MKTRYNAIQPRTTSGNESPAAPLVSRPNNDMRQRIGFPLNDERLLSVLGMAALLVAVMFVVDNYMPERLCFDCHEFRWTSSLSGSRAPYANSFGPSGPYIYPHRYGKYFDRKTYFSRPSLNNIIRSDICHVDFDIEKTVRTSDCTVRLACNARVVVKKTETGITVQAGYYIYPTTGKVRDITPETQERVQAATPRQATKWAEALVEEIGPELAEVDCIVSAQMIADAIIETKDDAASCPNTDDSLCHELVTLKECPCETEAKFTNACYNFLASGAEVTSFDDLKEGCTDAEFMYNMVQVSLPYCTFTCPSEPSVTRTFEAKFTVHGSPGASGVEGQKDGFSVAIPPAYKTFVLPVPSCDDAGDFHRLLGDLYSSRIYTRGEASSEPEFLTTLAAEQGVSYDFVYFVTNVPSVSDYISSVC